MKSVTYWYQFFTAREELVPIRHDVKFTKCEICGSTMLQCIGHRSNGITKAHSMPSLDFIAGSRQNIGHFNMEVLLMEILSKK